MRSSARSLRATGVTPHGRVNRRRESGRWPRTSSTHGWTCTVGPGPSRSGWSYTLEPTRLVLVLHGPVGRTRSNLHGWSWSFTVRLVLHARTYTVGPARLELHARTYTVGPARLVLHGWTYTVGPTRLALHDLTYTVGPTLVGCQVRWRRGRRCTRRRTVPSLHL